MEESRIDTPRPSLGRRFCAWTVHLFTMSGVIWACLAMLSLANEKPKVMWIWLTIALVVDAIDGTFARLVRVKEVIPWFDGSILDEIVDYLTWTFIPALFMYRYGLLGPKPVAMCLLILICTSSMFCYCNKGMKASDNYFVGFPAAWNIVAIYYMVLQTGWIANLIATVVVSVLTLTNLTFVHPFRVRILMPYNIAATVLWLISAGFLVFYSPENPLIALIAFWLASAWFVAVSARRTVRGRPDA